MKIKIHQQEEVYDILTNWMRGHNFPEIAIDMLSSKIFVCYNNEIPIYAISFYDTNSRLCWIGFPLSNPYVTKKGKEGGLDELLKYVEKYAIDGHYRLMFTTSSVSIIDDVLKNNGFILGDEKVNHYIKQL